MTQKQADLSYIRMAEVWSKNSKARRLQVGALIVKNKSIISDGFNGTPSGFDNWCEDYVNPKTGNIEKTASWEELEYAEQRGYQLKTRPEVLHAEANAITKVAKSTNSCEGATIYITHAPCLECSKLIIQSGIKRVVFGKHYRSTAGLELLQRANIIIDKVG